MRAIANLFKGIALTVALGLLIKAVFYFGVQQVVEQGHASSTVITTAHAETGNTQTIQIEALFAPETMFTNLERRDSELILSAKKSIDMAAYALTDFKLIENLITQSERGVKVRLYLDQSQYQAGINRDQRLKNLYENLGKAGVQVFIKSSHELMHFKFYIVDDLTVRTGSANFSPSGLKRQDNDLLVIKNQKLAALYKGQFENIWNRDSNQTQQ